jgi:hypothetical protein
MGGVGSSCCYKPANGVVRPFSDFLIQDSHGSEVSHDILKGSSIGADRHGLPMVHGRQGEAFVLSNLLVQFRCG